MSRSPSELEKLLWKSAEGDAPPSDGAKRLTAALTSRLVALAPSSAPPEPPCPVPTTVTAASPSVSWKLLGAVSVLLVPLAATFVLVRSSTSGPPHPPPAMETLSSPASGQIATIPAPPNAPEPVPSPVSVFAVDDLPPARTATTASTRRHVPADSANARTLRSPEPGARAAAPEAAPRTGRSSDLDAEVALLDEVRAHLRDGAPARATALVGQYDRRFPHGLLQPEAKVLQIEARAASGDRAIAHDLARAFLARYPNDPHAGRIRELEAQLRP